MLPSMSMPLACFLSIIRPPGVTFDDGWLQILPVDKLKCPYVRMNHDISFRLFTKYNPTVYQELHMGDDDNIATSNLDFNKPTVIYFHAFLESSQSGSALQVREAYMLRGDTNVIVVNAQRLEAGPWYITAVENTWYIGHFAAQFIDYLVSRGLDLRRTHLIGHSLGGQSAGVCGSALRTGRVARITALDPAKPLFEKLSLEEKLDPSDAEFVDVIHTDAGIFGVPQNVGHADFFPNAGISPQPGCELKTVIPRQVLLDTVFCSHWRSYQFYAESVIRPRGFLARACPSWPHFVAGMCREDVTHMGFAVSPKHRCRCLQTFTRLLHLRTCAKEQHQDGG